MRHIQKLFSATLGFDFIFSNIDGDKVPLCIEINGDDTGIAISTEGLTDSDRERVRVRMTHTEERLALSAYAESLDPITQADARKEAWAKARSVPGFIHAFRNPPYIQNIASKDKKAQQELIPLINRPRAYEEGGTLISRTGFWICKPVAGRKGRGIRIVPNEDFAEVFIKGGLSENHITQEFMKACGADNAPLGMKGNPASLRLLMDFIYFEDDSIEEVFTFAYQRVSPHSPEERESSLETIYVVNMDRGAKPIAASKSEFTSAHDVAAKIVRNIATHIKIPE